MASLFPPALYIVDINVVAEDEVTADRRKGRNGYSSGDIAM
jgi:hypothetical protein